MGLHVLGGDARRRSPRPLWDSVDFEHGVIRVQAGRDDADGEQETKTKAGTHTVPLAGRLRALMAAHKLATGRAGADLRFGWTATAAFVRSTRRARALRASKAAGLEPLTPHEGRHCCVSYLAKAGLTIKAPQEALGHADPRTTMGI